MHRHHLPDSEQLAGLRRLLRPHREQIANREKPDRRLIHLANQPHVAEDAGVAGEVHGKVVLESYHVAGGDAQIHGPAFFRHRAAVDGGNHRDRKPEQVQRAAGIHPGHPLQSFALEPHRHFVRGNHVRAARARQRDGVAGVILVAVRDQHQIQGAEFLRRLRARRIAGDPGVEHDSRAAGRDKEKRGVPEPGKRKGRQVS